MGMGTGMAMDTDMQTKRRVTYLLSGIMLHCLSAASIAQQSTPSNFTTEALATTQIPTWFVKPRVSLTETLTDNANVNRTSNNKQSELITEVAPGIQIEARTARLKAHFDYSLHSQFYSNQPDQNRSQNSLNTLGTFEAIDNWLFLDFSGIIAQQSISALGTQSTSNTTINNNSTETSTYRLSPYIRGRLAGMAEYSLRYNLSTTRSDANSISNVDISQWTGQLKGSTPFQKLNWTVDANQQTTDYSNGRKTEAELLRGIATYSVLPQFRVSLSGGRESNNYASQEQESRSTYGYGFDWNPTERTKLYFFRERRFFGNGHNVSFSHRFPMSSITYTDTRDVSVLPNQFATASLGTIYDLLYPQLSQLCIQQLGGNLTQSQITSCVLSLLGSQANTQVTSSFLTTRATIQRQQQLALAMFGVRNTLTVLANRSESQSAFASTVIDDSSQSTSVNQQGLSVNLSHRLSELSSLNLLASRQRSTGSGSTNIRVATTVFQVSASTKLGAKTSGSLSARRSEFDSNSNPYTENALVGSVSFIY